MKRIFKIVLLITLFASAVLVLSLPLTLPVLAQSAWFKSKVTSILSDTLSREVRVTGGIQLDFGWSPKITVEGFEIADSPAEEKPPMLRVGAMSLSGPLLANLKGDITVDEIASKDVSLLYRKDSKGESNWDFPSAAAEAKDDASTGPEAIVLPAIKKVTLEDLDIQLAVNGETRNVHFRSISARDIIGGDKGTLASTLKVDGIPIQIDGGLGSIQRYLDGSPLDFSVHIKEGKNSIDAKGQLQADAKSRLEIRATGDDFSSLGNLFKTELPPFTYYKASASMTQTHDGGAESIKIAKLQIELDENAVRGNIDLLIKENGGIAADLDIIANANHLKLKGVYNSSEVFDFTLALNGASLAALSPLVLNALPPVEDYELSGRLFSKKDEGIKGEKISLRIGESDLQGDISVKLSPLSIQAKLNSTTIDVDSLMALSENEKVMPEEDKQEENEEAKAASVIPYDSLENIEIALLLDVKNLKAPSGISLSDTSISATVAEGVAEVKNFSARLFDGSFKSSARAEKNGIRLNLDAAQIDVGAMLKSEGSPAFLVGNFNVLADLTAKGETVDQILESLSGKVGINSENARFENDGLHTASSGLADILDPLFRGSEEADSECIIFNYTIDKGIAESDTQVLKLKKVFIFAKGEIDIPENKLEYDFSVQSSSPALASLIPPFRAFGKLSKPYFVPSVSGTIASVADSGEAVVGAVTGVARGATRFVLGEESEKLSGVAVCRKAYELEQKLLSSRVGNLIKGKKRTTNSPEDKSMESVISAPTSAKNAAPQVPVILELKSRSTQK